MALAAVAGALAGGRSLRSRNGGAWCRPCAGCSYTWTVGEKKSALPWRLTFLADPVTAVHPAKGSCHRDLCPRFLCLCARQLTSVVGLSEDLELLEKRLIGGGSTWEDGKKDLEEKEKGNGSMGRKVNGGDTGDKAGKGKKEGK